MTAPEVDLERLIVDLQRVVIMKEQGFPASEPEYLRDLCGRALLALEQQAGTHREQWHRMGHSLEALGRQLRQHA
jgi:hypothetical protein